jgi:two-component system, OmpR family, sensor histidine kinase KdpD
MSESSPSPNRGALKLYLGYAAGVGKTYQMLDDAQRARSGGADIVVGYFEPHGRKDTIHKTEGLEMVPRRTINHRGATFEEMDTQAIIARHPAICVVDEFAHTNVPSSPRGKRWEDARLIRDAGIDVWTTINVQHIESLNDQVWQVTGIRPRETVPDWVVEEADEVVMVDVTPRALLHRIERGVVYRPEKARQALENFFTETNLTALRELALRQTAHQVEDHRVAGNERILIHLTADPSTAMLIRRGRRVADYLNAQCMAVFVASDSNLSAEKKRAAEKHIGFARSLHIVTSVVTGQDTAKAIAGFVREHNVTQLFISRESTEARRIVENAREIQVTIVAERRRS